jgi:hypothetical protein
MQQGPTFQDEGGSPAMGSFMLVSALSQRTQPLSSETVSGKPVVLQTIHMYDCTMREWAGPLHMTIIAYYILP